MRRVGAHRRAPGPDAAAIIVAGGKGLRFGGKIRKQYLRLHGRPLLWWSLKAFQQAPGIGSIVLVVPLDDVSAVRSLTGRWKFSKLRRVVPGGKTRQDSVREGLSALDPSIRWVAVHDAVRPLIKKETIQKALQGALKTGAAIAACPSRDTVKLKNGDDCVASTPPREGVWLAQTPQVIRRDLFEKAYRAAKGFAATDDAQLVERIGVKVKLIESPAGNIKVTLPEDLEIASFYLKHRG